MLRSAGTEQTALHSLNGFSGSNDHGTILIKVNAVAFAIGADDVGMKNEGQAFEFAFDLVFEFITFVDAQPELIVRGSATAYFDFSNTQEGLIVIVVFCEKFFYFFSCLRRESNAEHKISKLRV